MWQSLERMLSTCPAVALGFEPPSGCCVEPSIQSLCSQGMWRVCCHWKSNRHRMMDGRRVRSCVEVTVAHSSVTTGSQIAEDVCALIPESLFGNFPIRCLVLM